jgi:photosystem II stability/assembly factor-like uncharacterized protein
MKNIVLLFVLIILTITNNTKAQWVQTNGPYGGVINCIGSNSWELFAGTNGGLYRSTDNGSSWKRVTIPSEIYRSPIVDIYDIYVRDSTVFISTSNNCWVSKDDGLTWNYFWELQGTIQKFYVNGNYLAYIQNPEDADGVALLYVTQFDSTITRLGNGYGWLHINYPLTVSTPQITINSLVFNINYIVAGTSYGIYISSDTGKTWAKSNSNLTDTTIEAVAMYGNKLFAGTYSSGIFCSTDSGKTWSACNSGLTALSIMTISVNGNKIYAGTNGGGIFVSSDSGASWNSINNGLTNGVINNIYFYSGIPIALTNGSGIYKLEGDTWTSINNGLSATYISAFACIGNNLFAATDGGGVYLSNDDGSNWFAVNTGMTSLNVNALAVSGTNLFAGTLHGGVFLSSDNGASWKDVNNGITEKHISALTSSGNNIFAGTYRWNAIPVYTPPYITANVDSGMIYRSTDSGNSWMVVDTALADVYTLASIDSNVFASCRGGIHYSADLGQSWKYIGLYYFLSRPTLKVIIKAPVFAEKGKKLFAGTNYHSISMYNVQDTSWETVKNSGLFCHWGIQPKVSNCSVTAMTSNDTALFAACIGYDGEFWGLYISTDEGNNWEEINIPFGDKVQGLLMQPLIVSLFVYNNYLFVGTNGYGVWKVPLSSIITDIKDKNNEIPSKYTLEQNYPNPFNPTTVIKYDLPESGFVSLKVYDILGREVQTLVNGNKIKGTYEVSFNGSNLASGVYLYKLKAGNYISIKKMMLIK